MCTTPVALFVFNRPQNTASVFEAIREAQPKHLFVIADGPRERNAADERLCSAARSVVSGIDWPCEVRLNFAPTNMGPKKRIVSGLQWLFNQVDEAIILEDDCLPDVSFFRFCSELLERYRDDIRIAMINGTKCPGAGRDDGSSYYFSAFGCHWGWATWKRAWLDYDPEMTVWADPQTRRKVSAAISDDSFRDAWLELIDLVWSGAVNAWDTQWTLGQVLAERLAVVPVVNLVSNIGFSEAGTHTRLRLAVGANMVRHSMPFPLVAPERVEPNREYDARHFRWQVGRPDAESVIRASDQLVQASRPAKALLLIEAALRNELATSSGERDLLLTQRGRLLQRIRSHA